MLLKTHDRAKAIESVIHFWLKDKSMYCNNCNIDFHKEATEACCENPQIATNFDHCYGLIKQNKEVQKTRANDFASNKDETMRWGVSLPPRLYHMLNNYFKGLGEAGLFRDKDDLTYFMKKFPQFRIANRV